MILALEVQMHFFFWWSCIDASASNFISAFLIAYICVCSLNSPLTSFFYILLVPSFIINFKFVITKILTHFYFIFVGEA